MGKVKELQEVAAEVVVSTKVLDYVGADGFVDFLDTNLAGEARIMVSLVTKNGETREAFCSTAVSAELRNKKRTKDSLMFLNLVLNDKGRWIIQRERGKVIRVAVASLNLKQVTQSAATFEEAIGY
jgi:hypothetical protein